MRIVALTGRAGSGKTTAARGILERLPTADLFAFADAVKSVAADLYGLSLAQLHGDRKEVVDPRWGLTPRQILQRLGTEVCRAIHPETWTRYLIYGELARSAPECEVAVIHDLRFPEELAAVRARGGLVVRIVRPGLARWPWLRWPLARRLLLGEHASEAGIDALPVDREIVNDGTPEELQRLVLELLREHGIGPGREDLVAG